MYFKTNIIKKTELSIEKEDRAKLSFDITKWLNAHFSFQFIVALV